MQLGKRLAMTVAAAALVAGALAGPASAHKRTITHIHVNTDYGDILVQAWVDPECHPGTMKLTLKKKNAAGDWVNVATQKGVCQTGWGYTTSFDPVSGDKKCKVKAVFKSNNHPTISKVSDPFAC